MDRTTDARTALTDRLAELDGKLHEIEAELDSHQSRDWDELALEREGDEVLEGEAKAGQREIAQIKAALDRIEAGTYGDCARCGDSIDPRRLALLPATPLCAACAGAHRI